VLWAVRIGGIITLTALVVGVAIAFRRERRKRAAGSAILPTGPAGDPQLNGTPHDTQGVGGTA
jgi:hypothetical protein